MSVLGSVHGRLVFGRRIRVLSDRLARMLPLGSTVLDVGCGDGSLDKLLLQQRPDLCLQGVDVLVRPATRIPVQPFDGRHLPFPDASFDAVLLVDVLHHAEDAMQLLREAARVTRDSVVIKDHLRDRFLAGPMLRFMDYLGNAPHGVRLPYNYWPRRQWTLAWENAGLDTAEFHSDLRLYPPPFEHLFGGSLQFLARLRRGSRPTVGGEPLGGKRV